MFGLHQLLWPSLSAAQQVEDGGGCFTDVALRTSGWDQAAAEAEQINTMLLSPFSLWIPSWLDRNVVIKSTVCEKEITVTNLWLGLKIETKPSNNTLFIQTFFCLKRHYPIISLTVGCHGHRVCHYTNWSADHINILFPCNGSSVQCRHLSLSAPLCAHTHDLTFTVKLSH